MKELVLEMIAASKSAQLNDEYKLDMERWVCGTACCLCGDVVIARNTNTNTAINAGDLIYNAACFAADLDKAAGIIFKCMGGTAASIYSPNASRRLNAAKFSRRFTPEQLNHPHLQQDHNDRSIAIDYMENVILPLIEVAEQETSE